MKHTLIDLLRDYSKNGRSPFHMPGHKRAASYDYLNGLGAPLDITEIDGFDNLHDPSGILREGMDLLAEVYRAKRSFYLINGSTGGLLAAVRCVLGKEKPGAEVIVARNCHKAVYNAIELVGARPRYLFPAVEPGLGFCLFVTPEEVAHTLEQYPSARAVILTSPTYDGVTSDIAAIAALCHARKIPLIVDEAHGAHLDFLGSKLCDERVKSAVRLGADIVVQSFHKTLPSLTQTAVAHITGNLIDPDDYAAELSVFETSSPSYLLMASLDGCVRLLSSEADREAFFSRWREGILSLEHRLSVLGTISLYGHPSSNPAIYAYDRSKFILHSDAMDGNALAKLLRAGNIEPEMVTPTYVLLMSGADNTPADFDRLSAVLSKTERERIAFSKMEKKAALVPVRPKQVLSPSETRIHQKRVLPLTDVPDGSISGDYVFAYPPGIPIVAPGECIDDAVRASLEELLVSGSNPATLHGSFDGKIAVIAP